MELRLHSFKFNKRSLSLLRNFAGERRSKGPSGQEERRVSAQISWGETHYTGASLELMSTTPDWSVTVKLWMSQNSTSHTQTQHIFQVQFGRPFVVARGRDLSQFLVSRPNSSKVPTQFSYTNHRLSLSHYVTSETFRSWARSLPSLAVVTQELAAKHVHASRTVIR